MFVEVADYVYATVIETTSVHPFYVEGKGWVSASKLEVSDKLIDADGNTISIEKIEVEYLEEAIKVYNFEVDDFNNYFVSDENVLVHNKCDGSADVDGINDSNTKQQISLPEKSSAKKISWNEFQSINKGKYNQQEMVKAYEDYSKAFKTIEPPSSHGNSLDHEGINYLYALIDKDTREILKFGESINPSTRYSKKYLDDNNAIMKILDKGSKEDIHNAQHDYIEYYKETYGDYPKLNKGGW